MGSQCSSLGVHTGVLRDDGHCDCPVRSSDSEEEEEQWVQIYAERGGEGGRVNGTEC